MKTLRDVVGDLIGQFIPPDGWDATFKELNTSGWIDTKVTQQIILELCKRVEQLEKQNPNI